MKPKNHCRRWNDQEDSVVNALWENWPDSVIADILLKTRYAVKARRQKLGLIKRYKDGEYIPRDKNCQHQWVSMAHENSRPTCKKCGKHWKGERR